MIPAVAERAGGNPLFAEEIVRLLLDEGTGDTGELPDTVQALLAARLDSLEPFERRLVQLDPLCSRQAEAATSTRRSRRCARRTSSCPSSAGGWRASPSSPSSMS